MNFKNMAYMWMDIEGQHHGLNHYLVQNGLAPLASSELSKFMPAEDLSLSLQNFFYPVTFFVHF